MSRALMWSCVALLLGSAPGAALAGFTVPPNAPGQYAPRDECGELSGAATFREELRAAIANRDSAALARLSAPTIKLDFGDGEGTGELRRRLDGDGGEELWRDLHKLVDAGCAVDGDLLVMPWYFAQDLGDADPLDTWLIAGTALPLHKEAAANSPVVGRASWQLAVLRGNQDMSRSYVQVALLDSDIEGYVETARLRNTLDYRVIAERDGKSWRILSFIAGD